ncbi:MAG TPA: hypothetical protein VHW45_12730 [Candidatus Sulfotelmatobacter sp.]|jgi:hypothetical protein|nr:hypothetical protein [Candidatus Sulfotelmatobacter sp.]
MRRSIFIAAFALFVAVPLWAQHGGHGASGGHSFGGHSSGFASRGFSGIHMGASHFSGGRAGFRGPLRSGSFRGPIITNGFRNNFRRRGFFGNCFGFRCRNGSFNPWWGYDPWLWSDWSDTDSRFDADYYNNLDLANQMDQQSLNQQSLDQQRLLRQEQQDGDQDSYAPRPAQRPEASTEKQVSPLLPTTTVLIFRDEHKQEIQNYAIVGQTLWNFTPGRTQKIPLSSLDLAATEKANDDQGVTFKIPASNDGQ